MEQEHIAAPSQVAGHDQSAARIRDLEAQVKTYRQAYESEGSKFDALSSRYEEERHSRGACEARLKHLMALLREAEQELYNIITAMGDEDEEPGRWRARFCRLVSAMKPVLTHRDCTSA